MPAFKIQQFNHIAAEGLALLDKKHYHLSDNHEAPDAILLRSHKLHDYIIPESLCAIARAGAGVNNIPVEQLTERGIPVFNTPGANANAVKEMVIASLLLSCRHICTAWETTHKLVGDSKIASTVEKIKKQFAGFELPGKTLSVIGLGAIGVEVANVAVALGMRVIGFDPHISIQRAWQLSAEVLAASSMQEALSSADFVTVHVPYGPDTQNLVDVAAISAMPQGAVLINFARGEIVCEDAVITALNSQHLSNYVTDFPSQLLLQHPKAICLPHIGASTQESETNCAVSAAQQLRKYLEFGEIKHSVNFPSVNMPFSQGTRLSVCNANIPNIIGQISTQLACKGLNIVDMINKSRDDIAYTLIDFNGEFQPDLIKDLSAIEGVLTVRCLNPSTFN